MASRVKAIFFDVDGVLTDGKIIYDDAGRELKQFNVKDGAIIKYLRKAGVVTGVISGRESAAVSKRISELKIDFCHQGILDKGDVCKKLAKHYNLKLKEVAFIGDDLPDVAAFEVVGLSVCPADAPYYIRAKADIVTRAKGGDGVLREFADLVLEAKGLTP